MLMPWDREPRTLHERAATGAMWLAVILLAIFVTLVIRRAVHAQLQPGTQGIAAACIQANDNCDTGTCCAGLECLNHRCKPTGPPTTLDPNAPPTTSTTLPPFSAAPVTITAQDVSLHVRGGFAYDIFRGHEPNQYERDMMEKGLLGQWIPKAILFMETLPKCTQYVRSAMSASALSAITPRLEAVHQYEGRTYPPTRGTWLVKNGGNLYQALGYIMQHAHGCALSDPKACAASPLMTTDMADLLDLTVANGVCTDGAVFVPPDLPPMSDDPSDGLVDGKRIFPKLSAADDALLQAAIDAHMGGNCGGTPAGSVQAAQKAFIATAPSIDEMHFRTPPPFMGGCNPGLSPDDCCKWKALEHREYLAWANAVRTGDWGFVQCAGARHLRMHMCALLAPHGLVIRMPPCDGSYPDDTDAMTCAAYLAQEVP